MLRGYTAADAPFALQNAAVLSLHRMAAAHKPLEEALAADGATLHPALRLDSPLQCPPPGFPPQGHGIVAPASNKHTLCIWALRRCLLSAQNCAVSTPAAIAASPASRNLLIVSSFCLPTGSPASSRVWLQRIFTGCFWLNLAAGPP